MGVSCQVPEIPNLTSQTLYRKKVPWCSGQAYRPLEPVTGVRILSGLFRFGWEG
jgi:hypothetical protein